MSGLKGVSLDKRKGRYYARISIDGVPTRIGTYSTAEAAHAAYCEAARVHYGDFWSAGSPHAKRWRITVSEPQE